MVQGSAKPPAAGTLEEVERVPALRPRPHFLGRFRRRRVAFAAIAPNLAWMPHLSKEERQN